MYVNMLDSHAGGGENRSPDKRGREKRLTSDVSPLFVVGADEDLSHYTAGGEIHKDHKHLSLALYLISFSILIGVAVYLVVNQFVQFSITLWA